LAPKKVTKTWQKPTTPSHAARRPRQKAVDLYRIRPVYRSHVKSANISLGSLCQKRPSRADDQTIPLAIPRVSSVKPIPAVVVAILLTVLSEGSLWNTAPNVFSFSSRSCKRYITLATKTTKNEAYAKPSSVVCTGRSQALGRPARAEFGIALRSAVTAATN